MKCRLVGFACAGILAVSCGKSNTDSTSKISILIERSATEDKAVLASEPVSLLGTPPYQISGFDCLIVNVMGDGILDMENPQRDIRPDLNRYFSNANYCSYGGIMSAPFFLTAGEKQIDLIVPTGDRRVIQILGIVQGTTFRPCDAGRMSAPQEEDDSEYYVIDDARLKIQGDVSIPLANQFNGLTDAQKENRLASCGMPSLTSLPDLPIGFHFRGQDAVGASAITSMPFKISDNAGNLVSASLAIDQSVTRGTLLNGIPTVQFGSGSASYNIAGNSSFGPLPQFSYFIVARRPGTIGGGNKHPIFSLVSTTNGNTTGRYDINGSYSLTAGYQFESVCGTTGALPFNALNLSYVDDASELNRIPTASQASFCYPTGPAPWQLYSVVHSIATGEFRMHVNGETNVDFSSGAEFTGVNFADSKLRIGSRLIGTGSYQFMGGEIAEIIFYRTALADEYRVQVERYLCKKYALNCNLP